MSLTSVTSNQAQLIARLDAIIRELAALRQQLTSPETPQPGEPAPLIVEQDGQPQLAILPAESYQRFRQWEQREQARARIFEAAARHRAQPDWQPAFDLMGELSQRADLSDDELSDLTDRAIHAAASSDIPR